MEISDGLDALGSVWAPNRPEASHLEQLADHFAQLFVVLDHDRQICSVLGGHSLTIPSSRAIAVLMAQQ
jgi:hypothetical protein